MDKYHDLGHRPRIHDKRAKGRAQEDEPTKETIYAVASNMPAGLCHHPDKSQPFDITKSEVIRWLIDQPRIQRFVFDKMKEAGVIVFDQESKTWKGKNS